MLLGALSAVPNRDSARTALEHYAMAVECDRDNASAANSHDERPATIELLGDVHGEQVLEVGCGSGPATKRRGSSHIQ